MIERPVMITVALAQMDVPKGQPGANLARARDFAAQAREAGADLLLLPELWLHGYDLERTVRFICNQISNSL